MEMLQITLINECGSVKCFSDKCIDRFKNLLQIEGWNNVQKVKHGMHYITQTLGETDVNGNTGT